MTGDISAGEREQTPHTINSTYNQTINEALKRRAQSVITNKSIDAETRAIIRYGLEITIRGSEIWYAAPMRAKHLLTT